MERIALYVCMAFTGFLAGIVVTNFYFGQPLIRLAAADSTVAEYRERNEKLTENYNEVRDRAHILESKIVARAENDRRAVEEINGIGNTIKQLSEATGTVAQKLRSIIEGLQRIQERLRVLEGVLNNSNPSSGG